MLDKKRIKYLDFVVQNEFQLDEIIRKYGKTGDEIEEHITGVEDKNKVQIKRKFELVENLGTESTTKEEYEANITDSLYRKYETNDGIYYSKDNYEIEEITEDVYWKNYDSNDYYVFTDLNYEEFLNNFDFQNFDSFFENVVVNDFLLESLSSLKKLISKSKKLKSEMILVDLIGLIVKSINFLEEFKIDQDTNFIQRTISSYFIYYNNILLNNIQTEYKIIFPNITSIISEEIKLNDVNDLLKVVFKACCIMQEDKTFYEDADEDKRNKQVLNLISMKYSTKDQSQMGKSSSGKKAGSVDGILIDDENIEYMIEGMNLSSIEKKYIDIHLNKLESNYDFKGLPVKFALVYCNIKDGSFVSFSNKYKKYVDDKYPSNYEKNGESLEINDLPSYTESKVFKSSYLRESKDVFIYHILLKFSIK